MSQIWYAAFSEDFVGQAQKIFKKLDRDVIVTVWDPELVPEMLRRGVSVCLLYTSSDIITLGFAHVA